MVFVSFLKYGFMWCILNRVGLVWCRREIWSDGGVCRGHQRTKVEAEHGVLVQSVSFFVSVCEDMICIEYIAYMYIYIYVIYMDTDVLCCW